MKKTKVFAVSIISIKNSWDGSPQSINQLVCAIKAVSEAEAIGKGTIKGLAYSPLSDKWNIPSVLVNEISPEWFNDEEE